MRQEHMQEVWSVAIDSLVRASFPSSSPRGKRRPVADVALVDIQKEQWLIY